MNPKALSILLSFGIASGVSGSNLRQLKTDPSDEKKGNPPKISMDKTEFKEGEPITVHFGVGSPSDEYYSTVLERLNFDFRSWSIGLFMRDADPQGGSHPPIVSINICGGVSDCDVAKIDSVTFGSSDFMQGDWPLQVADYGTGYDAYVLDGYGAAAIGPYEFYVQDEYSG